MPGRYTHTPKVHALVAQKLASFSVDRIDDVAVKVILGDKMGENFGDLDRLVLVAGE